VLAYIIRRLLLVIPTLLAIMVINFAVTQFLPGGPVEYVISQIRGTGADATARVSGAGGGELAGGQQRDQGQSSQTEQSRGARGLDPRIVQELRVRFGFDKPPLERFLVMMKGYLTFDFGRSFYRDRTVIELVAEKLPVSISLGLWTTIITYLVCIPLGIRKALRDGSRFDVWSSGAVILGSAIPPFLFAVFLVVVFAGGSFFKWFPLRGIVSDDFAFLPWYQQILDYIWHMTLPLIAMLIGAFASLTMLTKNSFIDEINKQYVITARAKGLTERRVLYGHVFRNSMLIVIAGFPGAFIGVFFSGSLLIEIIFSLDGLGLLGFEAALNRDYPIMFSALYIFTLMGLVMKILSDFTYTLIDPRIDFGRR
jgi:microcin C transport system permease protein